MGFGAVARRSAFRANRFHRSTTRSIANHRNMSAACQRPPRKGQSLPRWWRPSARSQAAMPPGGRRKAPQGRSHHLNRWAQRGAGEFCHARKKAVPMVASKRCGSGEPSTSRPKAGWRCRWGLLRRGSRATDWARCAPRFGLALWRDQRLGQPLRRPRSPGWGRRKGMVSELQRLRISLAPTAKSQIRARPRLHSHGGQGHVKQARMLSVTSVGRSNGSRNGGRRPSTGAPFCRWRRFRCRGAPFR